MTTAKRGTGDRYRTIGVLGGMGPLATADFYLKLVRLVPARADQDHPHVIVDSNPSIPDRTAALLEGGPDPAPALAATAHNLERAGAELIAMPCNSAHAFLDAVRRGVRIPVLDMMDEVAGAAAGQEPPPRLIGVLGTTATLRLRLYHRALERRGLAVIEPEEREQRAVMAAIHAIKGGDLGDGVRASVRAIASALAARGADAIVLGCTELPLVLGAADAAARVLDATEILARAALRDARRGNTSHDGGVVRESAGGSESETTVPVRRS